MIRYKATTLLILLLLPFLIGSSNSLQTENDSFTINNNSVFSPGSNVSVTIYLSTRVESEFKITLFKIEDVKSFYSGVLSSNYNFDVIGKEILFKYTKKIKEWNQNIKPNYDYSRGNVHLGIIDEPGIYIVQALKGQMVAYCPVVITDYSILFKTTRTQILAFTQNVKSGEFLKDVTFTYINESGAVDAKSDPSGIALLKVKQQSSQRFTRKSLLIANTGKEVLVSNPYLYYGMQRDIIAYTYTNQPVYRPGQQVFFKSILREKSGNDLNNVSNEVFNVSIKSPANKEVYNKDLTTNETGSLWGDFILDEEASLGEYSIYIKQGESSFWGSFSVEEYKKPEYEVKVQIPKPNYSSKDVIEGTVNANYYFGSPVSKGTVTVKIFKQYYWRPWWYFTEYSWFYKSYERPGIINWREMELLNTLEGTLDEKGEYKFTYEVKENSDADYTYIFTADVVDASRRTISGSASTLITRGSFALFTSPDKYFIELGKPVLIKVNAADFDNKPVKTDFKVVFSYPDPQRRQYRAYSPYKDSITGSTDQEGKSVFSYIPKLTTSGYFTYVVSARDEKGRLITANGSFYYGERWYYNYSWGEGVQIITDKDTYKKGDSLTAYVFLPDSTTEFLLTYEANDIFYYKKEFAKENSITIKEKLDDRFAPSFNISVTYMKNGKFYNLSKPIGVLAEDKFLKVTITPDKKLYKPSDNASYTIDVKDYSGRPVPKTDISVGLIDEAIYSIKEESVQDITSAFYAPVYSWVPTNTSYLNNYSYGQSRLVNAIDKYFFDPNKKNQKGNGNLYGRAMNTPSQKLTGCELVLLSDDNFYSASVDTGGNYKFNNIVRGKYQLSVYSNDGVIYKVEDLEVDKNTRHDILINENELDAINNVRGEEGEGEGENIYSWTDALPTKGVRKEVSLQAVNESSANTVVYKEAVTRSNFVDAAFWTPSIMTGSDGRATVNFKMPDNLTKWRTTVRGMTAASSAGQDTIKTITRKDLIIRVETPRFFREGDELTVSTIVHNYLDQKKRTKISFKSDHLKLIESQINTPGYSTNQYDQKAGMYELTIDKNTELRIDWRVLVNAVTDTIKINAEALTDKESDAVELKVPLLPKGLKKVLPVIAEMENQNEEIVSFNIPEGTDLSSAKFMFNTSPSLSGTMLKALDELAGYPYGCVEQTMSRFLPTIIATNAFRQLKVPIKSMTIQELPKMVNEGLRKLYGFQQPDNGWGWWSNDQSSPYMTAYVVYGLALCKEAGYSVNKSVLENGINKLASQFEDPKIDETTMAYMIYSLSTAVKGKYDDMLMKKISGLHKEKLNPYSLALVTLALLNHGHIKEAEAYAQVLAAKADTENGITKWKRNDWNYCWYSDEVQTTAYALKALINTGVKKEIVSNGIKWLLLQRRGFYWRSTQETASIIFMLTDYLKNTDELNPDYNIQVYLNDQLAYDKKITSKDVYLEPELIRQNGNLKTGTNKVRIVKEGKGKVYFSGVNEFFTHETHASGKEAKFNVVRDYFVLKPVQKEGRIVYRKEYFDGEVKSGDDILVKTTVTSSILNPEYFMLEDMLPSGIEVVKDENKYEIEGENDYRYHDYWGGRHWRWFYSDREYRDEKVAFFVTYGSQKMEFSYIIKAQIPGSYNIMPSQASLMYYPEVNGNSMGYKAVIKDK